MNEKHFFIVEERDEYKGFRYEVHLYNDGHRTAYVRTDRAVDENEIQCHGGITYFAHHGFDSSFLPEGYWIGFDCLHSDDAPDVEEAERIFGKPAISRSWTSECTDLKDVSGRYSIKTLAFCRNECQSIIEQVILLDEQVKTIAVAMTEDQVETLLAILDCETTEEEPDWFFDREAEKVKTPFAEKEKERSVQEHLDKILKRENFPEIF